MDIERFAAAGKQVTLYLAEECDSPLVVLNNYDGDGKPVIEAAKEAGEADFSLLCVDNLNWNHDMSPWQCPAFSPKDEPFTGGADEYLTLLLETILPQAFEKIPGKPSHIGIAGYSLAGLFALYALYQTDVFDRAASMSGSLWYPGFKDYVLSQSLKRKPERLYISLGDKESKTRNQYLKTVQENTEAIVAHYRDADIDVIWELNPGNHFKDPEIRSAKGILAIVG